MRLRNGCRTLTHAISMGRDGRGPITRIERIAKRVCEPVDPVVAQSVVVPLTEATAKRRLLDHLRGAGKIA